MSQETSTAEGLKAVVKELTEEIRAQVGNTVIIHRLEAKVKKLEDLLGQVCARTAELTKKVEALTSNFEIGFGRIAGAVGVKKTNLPE